MNIEKIFGEELQKTRKGENAPYGDYLNAVDDLLELKTARTSTQVELAYIAECQEALCSPAECTESIILDEWK